MSGDTYNLVQSRYGDIANRSTAGLRGKEEDIARAFGYSAEDLSMLPEQTNLGLSCGNPVGFANVKEGETVLDLGSGSGLDVLLAARKVGPRGQAIGVDMTKSMIELAEKNIQKAGLSNARIIDAKITSIPLPDASVDCIISNCVINLVPAVDKPAVFREIARLLKPGGRVAVSDILARKPLPDHITKDMALYVGCVAGASLVEKYEEYLGQAGFEDVLIVDTKSDLNVYKESSNLSQGSGCGSCCGGGCATETASAITDLDFNEWVGSFQICALKA
ncbi:UbiE/COQ5 family methyltransferase [Aspergillus indologenus CBS 114.80]|uniref:Arsenite methyltransferase n=1 Tax=Aspergillus indologenus CBS 114.80 TaxID=1450541 RepID=A0A2V5J8M4_9EURO|nr:UbiE/COQ5 family methyltransferase [Aspergillus indologenus CBS 114.80]